MTVISNYQVTVEPLSDVTLKAGDKVKVSLKAKTSSSSVPTIQANFVDTTEAASWWTVLNDPTDVTIAAGTADSTEISATDVEFTIATDATEAGAAKFVMYYNTTENAAQSENCIGLDEEITLSDVELTITIN